MKNKVIGAIAMFILLNVPSFLSWWVLDVTYWKAYLTAFITTITVSIAYGIIEYLKSKLKMYVSKPDAKTV